MPLTDGNSYNLNTSFLEEITLSIFLGPFTLVVVHFHLDQIGMDQPARGGMNSDIEFCSGAQVYNFILRL